MTISTQAIQDLWWQFAPLYKHIGLTVESAQDGVYRCRVPFTPQNTNHLNTVHAAVQWAAAEVLGGIVVVATVAPEDLFSIFGAVRSVSIEFIRPARTAIIAEAHLDAEEILQIKQRVSAREEAVFRLRAVVRSESGEVVATSDGQYVIRPRRAAQPGAPGDGPRPAGSDRA